METNDPPHIPSFLLAPFGALQMPISLPLRPLPWTPARSLESKPRAFAAGREQRPSPAQRGSVPPRPAPSWDPSEPHRAPAARPARPWSGRSAVAMVNVSALIGTAG